MKNNIVLFVFTACLFAAMFLLKIPVNKVSTGKAFMKNDTSLALVGKSNTLDSLFVWFEITTGKFSDKNEILYSLPRLTAGTRDTIVIRLPEPGDYSFRFTCLPPKHLMKADIPENQKVSLLDFVYKYICKNEFVEYGQEESFTVVDSL